MDDPRGVGIEPESSPGPGSPTPSGPTPSTSGGAGAPEAQPPFHLHPRFRELTTENRTLKESITALNTRLAQIEQRSAQPGTLSAEERQQYAEAASALKRIFEADPELKQFFGARQYLPQLAEGYRGVQQLTEAQSRAHQNTARSHISQLAAKDGFPSDSKWTAHLVRLVAGAALGMPEGNQRYDSGDLSILDEAYASVKGDFLASLRKEASAQITGTKGKLKTLPPAPAGGAAGPEAPAKPVPGKEREFIQGLHKRGLQMLKEHTTG